MKKDNPSRPMMLAVNPLRGTTSLVFGQGRRGEFRIVCGMSCPIFRPGAERVLGALVLIGEDVRSGRRIVFEETSFEFVAPAVDPGTGKILADGVAWFFNTAWALYACLRYYHADSDSVGHPLKVDIRECGLIQPKPRFVRLEWPSSDVPDSLVSRAVSSGRLEYKRHGVVDQDYRSIRSRPGTGVMDYPSLRAVACALYGLRRPWRGVEGEYGPAPAEPTW